MPVADYFHVAGLVRHSGQFPAVPVHFPVLQTLLIASPKKPLLPHALRPSPLHPALALRLHHQHQLGALQHHPRLREPARRSLRSCQLPGGGRPLRGQSGPRGPLQQRGPLPAHRPLLAPEVAAVDHCSHKTQERRREPAQQARHQGGQGRQGEPFASAEGRRWFWASQGPGQWLLYFYGSIFYGLSFYGSIFFVLWFYFYGLSFYGSIFMAFRFMVLLFFFDFFWVIYIIQKPRN